MEDMELSFVEITKEPMMVLTPANARLNAPAAADAVTKGGYVHISVNPANQVIRAEPTNTPGPATYRIFENHGANLRVRGALNRAGMLDGKYYKIGDDIYQHEQYIK